MGILTTRLVAVIAVMLAKPLLVLFSSTGLEIEEEGIGKKAEELDRLGPGKIGGPSVEAVIDEDQGQSILGVTKVGWPRLVCVRGGTGGKKTDHLRPVAHDPTKQILDRGNRREIERLRGRIRTAGNRQEE
jgi:hypothetical protein